MKMYQVKAIRIAKDFRYEEVMPDIYTRIRMADSENRVSDILATARHADRR